MAALIHHHPLPPAISLKTITPPSQLNPSSLSLSKPLLLSLSSSKPQIPSNHEILHLLKLATEYSDTHLAKSAHASILKYQPDDTRLFNSLITSYLQLGHVKHAYKVLKSISNPDVVSYTAMMSGLAKSNWEKEAVRLFFQMRGSGIEPNEYTLVALLTASMRLLDVNLGSQVHALSVKNGCCFSCSYVANALMSLYGNCGCFDFVVKLFDEMSVNRDVASWNTVISCVVKQGMYDRAFELFGDMLRHGDGRVDYFTLSSLLVACARCSATRQGKGIHAYGQKMGYGSHLSVGNALIEFYSKCGGCLEDVERLFERMPVRDGYTWTEMISAYMDFGLIDKAVETFDAMPEKNFVSSNVLLSGFCQNREGFRALEFFQGLLENGMVLTDHTLTSVLNACGLMMDRRTSEQIHAFVLKFGFGSNDHIESALLDMCTRCGRMDDAEMIFHRLPLDKSSPFTQTSMICGYARNSEPEKAISLFCRWQYEGTSPMDEVALASILSVCGDLGFQNLGEQFHCQALKTDFFSEIGVGNAIVTMYSKCGDMEQAIKVFDGMSTHDIVSWNCLLGSYILNRRGDDALNVWDNMQSRSVQPNSITCLLVISAHLHTNSNLVEQCHHFFLSMKSLYNIVPNSDHYACLVSVLGNWGLLQEAEELICNMPFEPKPSVWRALLDSSRIHLNTPIGRRAAKKLLDLEPQDPCTYILKSNLYSASGRWHCSEVVRQEMKERGFRKFPGRSWFIHQNKVHSFFARDKSHLQSKDIYSALEILFLECLKAGYTPDTSFVLHEVEEHQKINFLLYHSGKLAVTYGILMTRPGRPVQVNKNIHLCGDCHTFLKYVSVVTKREIHVRDASGFHCFVSGECSCKDCW